MTIAPEEHRERQGRLRAAAAERGLAAVIAFSRGGGTHDRIADALWLSGLATGQPFVPDLAGRWRGAGHVAVIVAVDGPCTAVVDAAELQSPPVADEVVVAEDLIAAAADVLRGEGRIGVAGSDAISATWWAALSEHGRLEPADDLLLGLRRIKSPAEQRLLRVAGALGSRGMTAALDAAVPGAAEARVAAAFFETVVGAGGAIYDVVVSSGEASGTLAPSGGAAGAARWTTRTLHRLRPGVRLADVARRAEAELAASAHAARHGIPGHLMGGYWGHGLGLGWEPPWIGSGSTEVVEEGMCLAVERRAAVAGLGGAQYEDDVLVGSDGPELLTCVG